MTTHRLFDRQVPVPDAIVQVLEAAGIDMIFGMPGGRTRSIFDALFDHRDTIRTVLCREESLATVMAEVYGRLTGRPGVCMGQAAWMLGSGGLGVLEAKMGSSPMLLLTDLSDDAPLSHHAPYQAGTGDYGTWDARLAFGGITKETAVALNPGAAVQLTQLGVRAATSGEPGPIAICYHSSALTGSVGPDTRPPIYPTDRYLDAPAQEASSADVRLVSDMVKFASRPVAIAGNGVRSGRALEVLQRFVEAYGLPVATTASGKGVFPESHPLALGVMGNFGLDAANEVIADADVVVAIGTKLGVADTIGEHPDLLNPERQTIIQIDVERRHASWTFPADRVLIGDARIILGQLLAIGPATPHDGEVRVQDACKRLGYFDVPESASDAVPLLPQRVIKELRRHLPDDTIVTCDAGENRIFMTHHFQTRSADSFLQPGSIGGMGYAIPAAMAAKLVHPERPVVAVCGDGGFAIAMNGLMTARDERIAITTVVLNNSSLGWVSNAQGDRRIASEFGDFDHAAIARGMGCDGIRVETVDELTGALQGALPTSRPLVIDVVTSREETYHKVTSPLAALVPGTLLPKLETAPR